MKTTKSTLRRRGRTVAYALLGAGSALVLRGFGVIDPPAPFGIPEPITLPDIRGTHPHPEPSVLRLGQNAPASPPSHHAADSK